MFRDTDGRPVNRRRFLELVGAGGLTTLAGCSGGNDGNGGANGSDGSGTDGGGGGGALGDTLVGPDGQQVTLNLVWATGTSTADTLVRFVQQEYANLGIDVDLTGTTFDNMLAQYAQNTYRGTTSYNAGPRDEATSAEPWDLMAGIGFNAFPATPSTISTFWIDVARTQRAASNFYGYKPSEPLADLFDRGSSETDEQRRRELFARIFGVLSGDQPVNFLTFDTELYGFQRDVVNIDAGPSFSNSQSFQYQRQAFAGSAGTVGGPYTNGVETDAQTLNPIRIADAESTLRVGLTMDGAYTLDHDDEFVPRWVESYETDDQQTYRFQLRDDLQWGSGYGRMTAEDWVYYIREVRQAEENWAGDVNRADWFVGEEPIPVEQTGELRFEVRLPEVDPFFIRRPTLVSAYCLPRGLVEPYRRNNDGEGLNQDPAIQQLQYTGNLGPYSFERWDRNSVFVASRNDEYYLRNSDQFGDVPHFAQYSVQVFDEESTRLGAFRSGDITTTSIPPTRVEEFQNDDGTKVVQIPNDFCNMLIYNQRANGWQELRKRTVRRALSTAVNKRVIAERINRGFAEIAHTHQPSYSAFYDDSQVTRFGVGDSYDTAEAKRTLDEALPDGYGYE